MSTSEELKAISELFNDTEPWLQALARTDTNIFIEYVGKDSKGCKLIQGDIHKEIQFHIDECRRLGIQNCGILAPWGTGKTEQVAIMRALDFIGKDKNIRAQIICNTDDNAAQRVGSVSKYIKEDRDYKAVYQDILPGGQDSDSWGKHRIVVNRDSRSKDGTLEAWGITTSGTGSRADLQIYDDPVDMRNAILNPAMRKQVKESFKNVWMSRLVPGGFRIYIATIWHDDDLTSELLKHPEWCFLVMRVSEDFKSIECESKLKGKYSIPLWSYWSEEFLRSQYRQLGQRAFNRGYRQRALSDEDMTFPHYSKIARQDMDMSFISRDWPRVIGVDPFGKKVVIHVLALHPGTFKRHTIDIRCGKWDPSRTISEIRQAYLDYLPQIMVVENNASQEAICQWANEKQYETMPIVPFCTGSQKANPELGLPSLDVEFENDNWVVPMSGVDTTDNEHPFNQFISELRSHPVGEAADHVMAAWFAREGARFLMKLMTESNGQDTFTQEEVLDVARVEIGKY